MRKLYIEGGEPYWVDKEGDHVYHAATTAECAALIADYEEVLADHRRLVRELDALLNGFDAAPQASLCDIVSQVRSELI